MSAMTQSALTDQQIHDLRRRGWRGGIITPHRAFARLHFRMRDFWVTFPGNYAPYATTRPKLTLFITGNPGVSGQVSAPGLTPPCQLKRAVRLISA